MARPSKRQAELPSGRSAGRQPRREPLAPVKEAARSKPRRRPPSEPVTGLVLRKSPARQKLEQREREHERLLEQIARIKARCDALEALVRDAQALVHARTEGLRARVTACLRELHRTLDALLSPKSRLRRGDRAELRQFREEFLGGLPRPDELGEDPDEAEAPDAAGEEEGEPSARSNEGRAHASEAFGGEHASATKPGKDTVLLRALYRKLTLALHPDRASDAAEAVRLTALMKDVTRAYANEDLAQLMMIERTWLAQSSSDADEDLEARAARLQAANAELRGQLRGLTARLREGESWLPQGAWTQRDGPADAHELAERIGEMLERELRQVEGWRDAARALAAGQISLLQFMLGPRSLELDEDEEDSLLEAIDELLEGARRPRRAAARRRSRR